LHRQDADSLFRTLAERCEDVLSLGIVGGDIADQDERGVDLFAGDIEGLDYALRVLPFVEAGYLNNKRRVRGNTVMLKSIVDLRVA
jgi:hypothetical protein